jgi:hypothetical protein
LAVTGILSRSRFARQIVIGLVVVGCSAARESVRSDGSSCRNRPAGRCAFSFAGEAVFFNQSIDVEMVTDAQSALTLLPTVEPFPPHPPSYYDPGRQQGHDGKSQSALLIVLRGDGRGVSDGNEGEAAENINY